MQGDLVTLRMFGTGQVTIPNRWRKQFNTKEFIAVFKNGKIILTPIEMDDEDEGEWEVLFNADRDGGPISGKALVKAINKRYGQNK